MTDNEFKDAYQKAEKLYTDGKYEKAVPVAEEAMKIATDSLVKALRKQAWSAKHAGHKNAEIRDKMYEIAFACAKKILEISGDPEARNSAIKLLILLPGAKTKELCEMGLKELDKAYFIYQKRENLKAELKNSLGLEVRKVNPAEAICIFLNAYETVSKGTTLAGHLLHNAGTSWLIMANAEKKNLKKWSYLTYALDNLEKALKEYPVDQIGHIKAVKGKLNDIENKIKEANIKII